jgi:tetratricopeptide (TPR) repeat protein
LQSAYLATVSQRGGTPTPDAMRALRSFWVDDAEETTAADVKSDREVRLTAIRQLAQIVATTGDAGARAGWAERWRKATEAPSESLWALFYAGDGAATLDRVDTMMRESPRDSRIAQAFIWLALQTHQYDRLGTWLKDPHRTPSERDSVFIALGEELDATTGKIDPGLLKALFAEGTHLRPWQGAMLFAGRNRYREAITLARGVFDSAPAQRAALAQELANWHLLLGEPGPAREILRTTISSVADSLEAPVCAALCDYYRLLPEPDRPGFVESYLSGIDPQRQPLHAALAGAVLHGLAGNEGAAHADLDRLVDMRALTGQFEEGTNSGSRHLQFVLAIGAQLEAMKLEDLAIYFWERALADQALVQLQGDQAANLAHDIRLRLCVLRAATVPPGDLPQWLDLYERLSPTEGLAPLANALATIGAQARAVAIFRQVWERDPGDLEALRNLLSACRAAGDNGTAEAALRVVLSDGGSRLPDGARRDFLLEFADVLERESDLDGARVALSNAVENTPNDTRLLLRLGQLHERAGQPMEAINTYQRLLVMEPGNLAARLALSVLYENQNRLNDALALFQSGAGPDFDARLAVLQARNNQPEAALTTLDRILPPQHVTPALNLAAAFVARNDRAHARAAVQSALQRTEDPRLCFPLQCKVVELLVPEDKPVVARRELQRLRRFAINGGNPGLLASYLDFASTQAARLGVQKDFLTEARALWAEGSGPIPAGIALLTAQYDETEKTGAAATLTQLLARDDATDSWLQNAADYLEKTGHGEELARVQERICQVNPLNEQNFVNLAHTLKLLGRIDDARARLELLAARAMLNEDSLGKVAQAFLDLGDRPRAQALYVAAVGSDRFARNWEVWLEYARMQTAARDFANARRTLRTAYGVPANSDYTGIIEWLVAANRLHDADEATADFGLSPSRQDDFHAALFSYFEKAGQPANALAVAETHPTFVHPSFAVRLRKLAVSAHDFDRGARLLEKLAAQASAPEEFSPELARLHGDWAQTLLEAGDQEGTLANLRVAHEAHPELFEITLRFSALQQQRGDHKGAIETLQSFLAVAKAPAEIEQARAQLAKLRSGG